VGHFSVGMGTHGVSVGGNASEKLFSKFNGAQCSRGPRYNHSNRIVFFKCRDLRAECLGHQLPDRVAPDTPRLHIVATLQLVANRFNCAEIMLAQEPEIGYDSLSQSDMFFRYSPFWTVPNLC
jgi:hypothetical protein